MPSPLSMQILSAWEGRWNMNIHPEKCPVLWVSRSRKKFQKSTCATLHCSAHEYFISHTSEQKPFANGNAVSPTVLQSKGICSLLTSITFNPPNPSKLSLLKTDLRLQTIPQVISSSLPLPTHYIPSVHPCTCVCVCAGVVCEEYNTITYYDYIILFEVLI